VSEFVHLKNFPQSHYPPPQSQSCLPPSLPIRVIAPSLNRSLLWMVFCSLIPQISRHGFMLATWEMNLSRGSLLARSDVQLDVNHVIRGSGRTPLTVVCGHTMKRSPTCLLQKMALMLTSTIHSRLSRCVHPAAWCNGVGDSGVSLLWLRSCLG